MSTVHGYREELIPARAWPRAVLSALLLVLRCAPSRSAWARKSDRQQPMDVHSDHGDMSVEDNGVSILTGNVVVAPRVRSKSTPTRR